MMQKNIWRGKRYLALLLAAVLTISLCACGDAGGGSGQSGSAQGGAAAGGNGGSGAGQGTSGSFGSSGGGAESGDVSGTVGAGGQDGGAGEQGTNAEVNQGGADVRQIAGMQAKVFDEGLAVFILEDATIEPGSRDVYQIIFDTKGVTCCLEVRNTGIDPFVSLYRANSPGQMQFGNEDIVSDSPGTVNVLENGSMEIRVGIWDDQTRSLIDFTETEQYTVRYIADNGAGGQAEKTFAAKDVRHLPVEYFGYEDDGNGGIKITHFELPYDYDGPLPVKYVYIPREIDGKLVTTIGTGVFAWTDAEEVIIPDSVTTICKGAFQCCGIKRLYIPANVTLIECNAVTECDELENITIVGGNAVIEMEAFSVPAYSEGCGVVTLDVDAKSIGARAFYGCPNLTNATIRAETVGIGAFARSEALTDLTVCAEIIGEGAFHGCLNLTNVNLENGIKEIHGYCFGSEKLTSIVIPESVNYLGLRAVMMDGSVILLGEPEKIASASIGGYGIRARDVSITYQGKVYGGVEFSDLFSNFMDDSIEFTY